MMNGIINIYKEKGFTSFDVVAKLRGILKTRKIGHTGTLDPDAEGVLPVCIGKATKICELLTDKTKEYEAVMLLGRTTDTQDVTGETLTQQEVHCSAKEVEKAVLSFVLLYLPSPAAPRSPLPRRFTMRSRSSATTLRSMRRSL